ncbi:hypothetical protein OEA41_008188 [Lepraria neglecta]|uniref:DUF1774-domain-containing protein n=1 Tax=Lepraria neglecta TaxID=209136 RepID=A0AAE0DNY6_9LECA|nr:hypothetical protein OEA41_008188 [Lepraria neglecta]
MARLSGTRTRHILLRSLRALTSSLLTGSYSSLSNSATSTFSTYSTPSIVNRDANVGSQFILHSLLQIAFLFLWVYDHFWYAEAVLVLNDVNLKTLYFRHLRTPRYVHIPVVTGPLAWTFIAILSNGATMVNAHSYAARICANIAIWSILLYGTFFLLAFMDYAIGFELSILSLALAVHQLSIHVVALQWIFGFIIIGLLLLVTLAFAILPMFGKELILFSADDDADSEDWEREPLLA